MKHGRKALLVALCLSCFLTACAPKMETPNQTNPSASTNTDHTQNSDGGQDLGALPEHDPNAEYIQNYLISADKFSSYTSYADGKYFWVKLYKDKNAGKIKRDSWAAIDETGKVYGIVPLENEHYDVEYFNEFLCVEKTKLYKYDGSEVTSQYLNNGETLLRITKGADDFVIWKYQTDKKYQEETVYTLRICNTNGDILFEMKSNDFSMFRAIKLSENEYYGGKSASFKELSNNFYCIQYNSDRLTGETFDIEQSIKRQHCIIIDLSTGEMFDIEQYDAVQKLRQNSYDSPWALAINVIDNILFVPTSFDWSVGEHDFYAYKIGEMEPLYSMNRVVFDIMSPAEDRFLYSNGDIWALYDIYTGEQVYTSQNSMSSYTYDEIEYSTKYNVYIEQVGDFVGVFSEEGTPCFEPIEGELIANWLDYNGNLLIQYKGHAYDGAGLYVVDMNGNMTMLSITGSAFALNAQNRIMVVDSDGTYKLYDKDWNQLF